MAAPLPPKAPTLVLEALAEWSGSQPSQRVWTFLDDKGEVSDGYTYRELDRAASSLAAYLLQSCKLRAGDRALLVFFPGLHFMASLVACFKAGIIAIPVFPPDPRRLQKDLTHFISIQSSSGATVALTHNAYNFAKKVSDIQGLFSTKGKTWPSLTWHVVDDVLARGKAKAADPSSAPPPLPPMPHPDSVAFLQYTSGSTSEPKGVMITHGNLGHNLTLIIRELKATRTTVNVSWLPQYHDMGLIGSYLGTLYCGGTGFFLSPISFLKDPNVWLRSIARFRGTHTQAPNFAYALAARKFRDAVASSASAFGMPLPQFRLDSLQHMINAAEPVDQRAIANFYETFRPHGLPSGVVVPTYGLAEHTVFVCSGGQNVLSLTKSAFENKVVEVRRSAPLGGPPAAADDDDAAAAVQTIVGCGYPERGEGVVVVIVDAESRQRLPDGRIGEIWVASPSKALGYWNLPDLTAEDFHATLADGGSGADHHGGGRAFLRTGDLGFLHRGELFICGRSKDLIIVRGRCFSRALFSTPQEVPALPHAALPHLAEPSSPGPSPPLPHRALPSSSSSSSIMRRGSNHYPQDIERTAERSQPSLLRPGCSAAFAVKDDRGHTEAVVYVAEVMEAAQTDAARLAEIIRGCRAAVSAEHGLTLSSVVLLRTRTVPKTTSGKIARAWCRKAFVDGTLSALTRWDGDGSDDAAAAAAGEAAVQLEMHSPGPHPGAPGPAGTNLYTVTEEPGPADGPGGAEARRGLSVEEVRALPLPDIVAKLESTLKQIAAQGPAPLTGAVDPRASLLSLGLDSFTIVQFKGVIEKRFYCDIPDEFLFIQAVNLHEIAVSVKHGSLTPEQRRMVDGAAQAGGGAPGPGGPPGAGGGRAAVVASQKQPMCPWCVCCY